jgi:hypothetical protein
MVTGSTSLVSLAQADLLVDKARIAVAGLTFKTLSMPECVQAETIGDEVARRHYEIGEELFAAVQSAWQTTDAAVHFLGALEFLSFREDQKIELKKIQKAGNDGFALARLQCTGLKSKWTAGLQVILDALVHAIPENWKEFCVDDPDCDLILEHVVENPVLDKLLDMITDLTNAENTYKDALEKTSRPGGPVNDMDDKLKKSVKERLDEAKLLMAIRACENVTLKKLPLCKTQKSRASTAREAKRLIGKLEGPDVPSICMKRLDEASAGNKPGGA